MATTLLLCCSGYLWRRNLPFGRTGELFLTVLSVDSQSEWIESSSDWGDGGGVSSLLKLAVLAGDCNGYACRRKVVFFFGAGVGAGAEAGVEEEGGGKDAGAGAGTGTVAASLALFCGDLEASFVGASSLSEADCGGDGERLKFATLAGDCRG